MNKAKTPIEVWGFSDLVVWTMPDGEGKQHG